MQCFNLKQEYQKLPPQHDGADTDPMFQYACFSSGFDNQPSPFGFKTLSYIESRPNCVIIISPNLCDSY